MAIFLILEDGGRRHLGFLKFQLFNSQTRQESGTASSCHISWRSVKPSLIYGDFSIFPKMAAVRLRHLGFVTLVFRPPVKAFGGLYHCAKFS